MFKEILKKFWFVALLAILAVGFIGYFAWQEKQNEPVQIATKQVDGNYLIYSGDQEISLTADELYETLVDDYAVSTVYSALERYTIDALYETTGEMNDVASQYSQYLLMSYDSETLDKELKAMGFGGVDDLSNYYIYIQKRSLFIQDYLKEHQEDAKAYIEANNSKVISHILVSVEDVGSTTKDDDTTILVANATEEEQAKLDNVLSLLETTDFTEVAYEYSDDTGSASNYGSLGYYDTSVAANYVSEFSAVANTLKEGEVSEATLSEYGWHIIKCDASTFETLVENDYFLSQAESIYANEIVLAVFDKANELGIEIKDENIKTMIQEILDTMTETESEAGE